MSLFAVDPLIHKVSALPAATDPQHIDDSLEKNILYNLAICRS